MKITQVGVKNFRSYVVGQNDAIPILDVGDGLNLLVGPNNCGKSNLLRAIALALDTKGHHSFEKQNDVPAQMSWAYPTITLSFHCDPRIPVEDTLLRYARTYEESANVKRPYADAHEIHFRVSYTGSGRSEVILARGAGNRRGDAEKLQRVLAQFHKCIRFIYLKSGESLSNFLVGAFRELLHTVLRDHLKEHVSRANERRDDYIKGVVEELLQPLQSHAITELQDIMAELVGVSIVPHVPKLSETLAKADIVITDTAETALLNKGTGVRGALLVALLSYLAENSRRSLILAVEEPESFLHPEAQRALRSDLVHLAERSDVTLLVTTHSPFLLDRSNSTRLTTFKKGSDGRTIVGKQSRGDEPHTDIAASLFGETVTPNVLESVQTLRPETQAVLFVEGYTDKFYMEQAAEISGRLDLLSGLEIRFDNGADKAALQALLLRQMTQGAIQLGALFDWDDVGRKARDMLVDKYKWPKKSSWTYRRWREDANNGVPVEAEDMFDRGLLEKFVQQAGDCVLAEKVQFRDGTFHYGFTQNGKDQFLEYLGQHLTPSHVSKWLDILQAVRRDLGLAETVVPISTQPTA